MPILYDLLNKRINQCEDAMTAATAALNNKLSTSVPGLYVENGVTVILNATKDVFVPLPVTMPDTNYDAVAQLGASGLSLSNWTITILSKTTTGVNVRLRNNGLLYSGTIIVMVVATSRG